MTDSDLLARIGYEAYGEDAGWCTWDGRPMPAWADLPPVTRDHWEAAAAAIAQVVK